MEDPYINSNGVLINKLGITDYDELNKLEAQIGSVKLKNLDKIKITSFNEDLIQDIHGFIFHDVFDWAGNYRTTPLFKEELVLPRYSVPYSEPNKISHDLNRKIDDINRVKWNSLSDEELILLFARKTALMWKVHPFRDGNTRTILSFSYLFAREYGFDLDMNVFLMNLMRIYKNDKIVRYSIRDKFVLASLDDKDYPEVEALAKVYKKARIDIDNGK